MQGKPKTTFTRRGQESSAASAPTLPEGTRKSIHNVGTVVIVEEDRTSAYYQNLFGYFLGEGLACNQATAICSASKEPEKILKSAPRVTSTAEGKFAFISPESDKEDKKDAQQQQHDLKIAWQYQKYLGGNDLGEQGKQVSGQAWCHNYDIHRPIDPNSLIARQAYDHFLDLSKVFPEKSALPVSLLSTRCKAVYSFVCGLINEYNSKMASSKQSKILRLVIHGLSSPSWGTFNSSGNVEVLRLLHALRGLMRASLAVCMVSIPSYLFDPGFVTKLRHTGDTVVRLESFADIEPEQVSPVFQDFDGMFHIHKLGSMVRHVLDAGPKMTFVTKQKKMAIEAIYLPPEISRTTTNNLSENELKEKQQHLQKPNLLCQTGPDKNILDF